MKTATYIRTLEGYSGVAKLYKLSEPIEYYVWEDDEQKYLKADYVVVSAANVLFSGPETYIFPADENGEVISWLELDGSYRGGLNHEIAVTGAGYELSPA